MDIQRNKKSFVEEHNQQIKAYKEFKSMAKQHLEFIEKYDGKVLNKRIEKLLPICSDYRVTLGQSDYSIKYVSVLKFYCRVRKYSSNVNTDFEIKLATNSDNRFQFEETKLLLQEQFIQIDKRIAEIEKAIENFDECMEEWCKIREMYEDWQKRFSSIERDNNHFTIYETKR